MQYIPVNTFGLILIIIRKTPRRRVPVSLCDGYCQRLTKKNRDLHTGPVVMSCAALLFSIHFPFFIIMANTCVLGRGWTTCQENKEAAPLRVKFVWFSMVFCHVHHSASVTCLFDLSCQRPEAAPSLVSCATTQLGAVSSSQHELAARARKILRALRAFGWVRSTASNTVSFRQPWKMMEKKWKNKNTPTHSRTHRDTDTDTGQPLKLVKLIFKNPAILEKKHRFGTCEPNQVQTANLCKHHQTSAHHTRTGLWVRLAKWDRTNWTSILALPRLPQRNWLGNQLLTLWPPSPQNEMYSNDKNKRYPKHYVLKQALCKSTPIADAGTWAISWYKGCGTLQAHNRDQKLICRVPACASSLTEGWTCDYMAASPLHQSSGLTNLWCVDGGFHLKMSEDVWKCLKQLCISWASPWMLTLHISSVW